MLLRGEARAQRSRRAEGSEAAQQVAQLSERLVISGGEAARRRGLPGNIDKYGTAIYTL